MPRWAMMCSGALQAAALRTGSVAHLALPALVALILPPRNTLFTGDAILRIKFHALSLGYTAVLALLGAAAILNWGRHDAHLARPRWRLDATTLPHLCLGLFLLQCLAAAFLSGDVVHALRRSTVTMLPPLLAWAAVSLGLAVPAGRLLVCVTLTALVVGLAVPLQVAGINPFAFAYDLAQLAPETRSRAISTLGNPEYVGGYLAATSAAALVAGLVSLARGGRGAKFAALAWLAPGGVLAVCMLATGTRGALLGWAAGIAVGSAWVVAGGWRLPWRLMGVVAGGGALMLLALMVVPNPSRDFLLNNASRYRDLLDWQSPSVTERVLFNLAGADIALRHPLFGVGPGGFESSYYPALGTMEERDPGGGIKLLVSRASEKGAGNAHNDYLQFAAEIGLPGLVLFLGMAAALLLCPASASGGSCEPLLPALRAGLAALLVSSLFSFPLRTPGRATLFWALVAAIMVAVRQQSAREQGGQIDRHR